MTLQDVNEDVGCLRVAMLDDDEGGREVRRQELHELEEARQRASGTDDRDKVERTEGRWRLYCDHVCPVPYI
jgi:hypothetical protein